LELKKMKHMEDNKLIAEFIGGWKERNYFVIETPFFKSLGGCIFAPSELKFDSDWNWLMEVVEKIQNVDKNNYIKIDTYHTFISVLNKKQIERRDGNKLLSTYNACVEFIKWYNQNKK